VSRTATLVAVFLFLGVSIWFLRKPSTLSPLSPAEAPIGAPMPVPAPTGTGTETFAPHPTVEPAPAKLAPKAPPADFEATLQKTQAGLPTREQIAKLKPSEQHKTPVALFEAGTEIGKVAEAIEKDPSLAPQGIDFYGKCARRKELSTSVRALCLGNLRDLARDANLAANEEGVDPKIKALADKLNEK
jgi:hypothetical protein